MANQNKEYINVCIHIILNVNMIDLLWLVGATLVLPWKSLSIKSVASLAITPCIHEVITVGQVIACFWLVKL